MSDVAIRVEKLSKLYRLGWSSPHVDMRRKLVNAVTWPARTAKHLFNPSASNGSLSHNPDDDLLWALKDVSFEVKRGEILGVIGRNGAGKSTLLKILSRITEPTSGQAEIFGRVGSLLEVGTGFHPDLTGRENIYLNGAILGMRRREVDEKFDDIIEFSEVGRFIDTPVKRYSSGMYTRLAFAVAAHFDPEVMIVDEVLAVGDASFQRKCLDKMSKVASSGRTVLFVSHNMASIQALCSRAILLSQGSIVADGDSNMVVNKYLGADTSVQGERDLTEPDVNRSGNGDARWRSVSILNESGEPTPLLSMGTSFTVEMQLDAYRDVDEAVFAVAIFNDRGMRIAGLNSFDTKHFSCRLEADRSSTIRCHISDMRLMPGIYTINLLVRNARTSEAIDLVTNPINFEIVASDVYGTGRIPVGPAVIYADVDWHTDAATIQPSTSTFVRE